MIPLANRLRPKSFSKVVGQDHLVGNDGILKKMQDQKKWTSFILYGPPGVGKTSIANIIGENFGFNVYHFNAATDDKQKLKDISHSHSFYPEVLLIIDEIHRMKKDIMDYLLPFLEDGSLIIIGLTTQNPYQAINPAIRSRMLIFKMNELGTKDIRLFINNAINSDEFKTLKITEEALDYLVLSSGNDLRAALNSLEVLNLYNQDLEITITEAKRVLGLPILGLDSGDDHYFDILSAFQKSIRGSDPQASLHYLARLLTLGDLNIISRRLMVIAYEDIGLANPQIGPRVYAATQAALALGLPEGRIPLSAITIDLALSPKSNSAITAIDLALSDYNSGACGKIPAHILNREIKTGKVIYKYPHDYPNSYIHQQYLPDNMRGKIYYTAKETGSYERALKAFYEQLKNSKD